MIAAKTLLDTDTLSAFMRKKPAVMKRAIAYRAAHSQFSFSLMSRFEMLRGMKARGASAQMAVFEHMCQVHEVLPITESIIVRAADIYADLHRRGELIPDADLIIGATAIEYGYVLATNNVRHFARITGLVIDNWLA